jgi:hypothetical protein
MLSLFWRAFANSPLPAGNHASLEEEEEEEERSLIVDLKRHTQLAVAWNRHGSPVPRWT